MGSHGTECRNCNSLGVCSTPLLRAEAAHPWTKPRQSPRGNASSTHRMGLTLPWTMPPHVNPPAWHLPASVLGPLNAPRTCSSHALDGHRPVMLPLAADAVQQEVHLHPLVQQVHRGLQHAHVRFNAQQQHLAWEAHRRASVAGPTACTNTSIPLFSRSSVACSTHMCASMPSSSTWR